jgi:hypothetical protein
MRIIGISIDKDYRAWSKYLLAKKYLWMNYLQNGKSVLTKALNINEFPYYIILNNKGQIIGSYNSIESVAENFNVQINPK